MRHAPPAGGAGLATADAMARLRGSQLIAGPGLAERGARSTMLLAT